MAPFVLLLVEWRVAVKRIYTVTYKPYDWKADTIALSIVASSLLKATQAAPAAAKRKGHNSPVICTVETGIVIDRIA